MSLKIIAATDPLLVETVVLTIYAPPGLGKSSLLFTADNVLALDPDRGSYRASNRKDVVSPQSWSDMATMTAEELSPYGVIGLDTVGRALDLLTVDITKGNPKLAQGNGALSQRGYGELKARFQQWLAMIRSFGKDVVLVAHMTEEYKGDDIIERLDVVGSSKNEVYKCSDAICRIQILPDGSRVLNFDPSSGGYGKNPAQLERIPFLHPDKAPDTLAKVLAQIKTALNRQTEAQADAVKRQQEWVEATGKCTDMGECATLVRVAHEQKSVVGVDLATKRLIELAKELADFNGYVVPLMKDLNGAVKTLGATYAKGIGWKPDKTTGLYVDPTAKPAEVAK
jgi:hypothetical protein